MSRIIRGEDKENGAAAQDKVSDRVLNHYEYDAFGNTISCEERVANRFRYQSGLNSIDDIALKHSSVGDFTYNPKTGQISRLKCGGHGQSNIKFLEENGIEYNIVKEYDNGVRVGNVPKHKTPSKRTGTGQAWFPENWSDSKIKEEGNYVTNLPDNKNLPDGVIGYGEYDGVRVGIIKTSGKIGTIFPDADLQP